MEKKRTINIKQNLILNIKEKSRIYTNKRKEEKSKGEETSFS